MKRVKPSSKLFFLLTVPRRCFFCGSFLLFMFYVRLAILSVHCSLVITCWERPNLLALLCVVFLVFCHFPMWCTGSGVYLIVSIPDLCFVPYFQIYIFSILVSRRMGSKAEVLLVFIHCLLFLPLFLSLSVGAGGIDVFGPCFVLQYYLTFCLL